MLDSKPAARLRIAVPSSVGLIAVILLSVLLRAWNVRQGLPDFLDEAIPFKRALEMWGWETGRLDLNPHFFNYPTLAIYLHLLAQKLCYAAGLFEGRFSCPADFCLSLDIDPSGPVVAARWLGIVADAVSVWMAWRLGERLRRGAGIMSATLVAFSPVFIITARAIHVDSIMTALLAVAMDRLLAWRQRGGPWRLAGAVALVGLAAGAKYTAGLLVLPLAWVLWNRAGMRGLAAWPALALASLAVFVLSSPWAVLDFAQFRTDFAAESLHMREGHLGVSGASPALHYVKRTFSDPGLPAILAVLLSLRAFRRRDPASASAVAIWTAVLPLSLGLLAVHMEADRYLEPVLLLAAPLAASASLELSGHRRGRLLPLALSVALLLPVLVAGLNAAHQGRDDTRQQARRWCETHLERGELMLQEPYGARVLTTFNRETIVGSRYFAAAGDSVRARFLSRRTQNVVSLPMLSSGRLETRVARPGGSEARLIVFAQAMDFSGTFYDPGLLDGVDYVLVSGAMRRRYLADPARFAPQAAWYARIEGHASMAARFDPGDGVTGPEIVIYRLGDSFWRQLREENIESGPYWWARLVPLTYRRTADAVLGVHDPERVNGVTTHNGEPSPWVLGLRPLFYDYVLPFELEIGMHLANRGQFVAAQRHASAILAIFPESGHAARLFAFCAAARGDHDAARRQVEATLAHEQQLGLDASDMREELARIEARAGARAGQPPGSELSPATVAPGVLPSK